MGNKKSSLSAYEEAEEIELAAPGKKPQIEGDRESDVLAKEPLIQISGNKLNEDCLKLPEEKAGKKEFLKSRQKLGELKVKKAKEFRATNKQNEDGDEVEHLTNLTLKVFVDE